MAKFDVCANKAENAANPFLAPLCALVALTALLPACRLPDTAASPLPSATPDDATADIATYCHSLRNSSDPFFGTQQRQRLLAELSDPAYDTHSWRIGIMRELARDHLRFGETDAAIRLLTDALAAELNSPSQVSREADLLQDLAVAHLKDGELRNCVSPEGRLICALPLDASLSHADKRGSSAAIARLTRLLELEPDNLRARWLLNIAHMTLGTYPQSVPPRYRVPKPALSPVSPAYERGNPIRKFDEIAPYAGLYAVNTAGGSIIEDFDNDGLADIMTSTWHPCQPIAYYRNEGNGRFADYTARAGLSGQLGGLNIVQTDYNNDGLADALVMRGGWMRARGQTRMSLLRNDGDNTFTDVTHAVGLALPAYPSQSAAWADYDNDGDLDLYSCSETMTEAGVEAGAPVFPSRLFRNHDGAFTDITQQAGVANMRFCKGSAWGDYDNDGDPDLYVSNFGEPNRLYRNDGGIFTDVAAALGVADPLDSFAAWFWDYNNDGWLDLFVAGYGTDIGDVAADYLALPNHGATPRLYRNDGAGNFHDVTQQAGLSRVHLAMGANFGDLDNDGYLDFYLGTGYPSYDALAPNIMYRNDGEGRFQDVTFAGGFGHLQKGHGISFGDLDNDGDQDIFAQVGGFYPGDGFVNALYRNPGNANRWLTVRLVGAASNRAAIGARVKVTVAAADGERSVHALVGSGGSFGASTLAQEIGLGQARRIIALEAYWPTTGIRQRFTDVPLDSHIVIREDSDEYETRELAPVPLGALP